MRRVMNAAKEDFSGGGHCSRSALPITLEVSGCVSRCLVTLLYLIPETSENMKGKYDIAGESRILSEANSPEAPQWAANTGCDV